MSLWTRSTAILSSLPRCASSFRPATRSCSTMAQSSPFTNAVVSAMRRLYPEGLADKSFDNTGLLLEAPYQTNAPKKAHSVLLTIDLTKAVADEAIAGNHSAVVAYHPIIFRGLKALTLDDTQQSSLLRLAANGTSVYCPHTAVDIVPGGMADWLCDIVAGTQQTSQEVEDTKRQQSAAQSRPTSSSTKSITNARPGAPQRIYSQPTFISHHNAAGTFAAGIPHTRSVVTPSPDTAMSSANEAHKSSSLNASASPYQRETTGAGRLVTFNDAQPLPSLIQRIASAIGNPKAIQIAIPQTKSIDEIAIKTIGLCPGSGSSVLRAARPAPDLIFTGEMSHHEALAVIERGGVVITLGHSNSERGYLSAVMQSKLTQEVKTEWDRVRSTKMDRDKQQDRTDIQESSGDGDVQVVISQADRDPFGMMVLEEDE